MARKITEKTNLKNMNISFEEINEEFVSALNKKQILDLVDILKARCDASDREAARLRGIHTQIFKITKLNKRYERLLKETRIRLAVLKSYMDEINKIEVSEADETYEEILNKIFNEQEER